MERTSYSYNQSFEIKLVFCELCNTYHNEKKAHICKSTSQTKVDIIEEMKHNLQPKVKPRKKKK